jgi:hypothetical protein
MSITTTVLLVAATNAFSFIMGLLMARVPHPKCLHDWKVMDKHVEEAPLDKRDGGSIRGPSGIISDLHRGRYICIMACSKCGAIDKTVEEV